MARQEEGEPLDQRENAQPKNEHHQPISANCSPTSSFASVFSYCSSITSSSADISTTANSPPASPTHLSSLVSDLDSDQTQIQVAAASDLRRLAKNSPENRLAIAKAGAALPLISLLSSDDTTLQEHSTTALLNLSLLDVNRPVLAAAGVIPALISHPLRHGTPSTCANAACALLRLSQLPHLRPSISPAIPSLVDLLRSPHPRSQKDAATVLYALCSNDRNARSAAARAGVVRPVVELLAAGEKGIADKAAYLLTTVASVREAREDLLADGGVPVLVEVLEEGTPRQREAVADVLLRACGESAACRAAAEAVGAVSALAHLSRSGSDRAKRKAGALLELLVAGSVKKPGRVFDVPAEQCC